MYTSQRAACALFALVVACRDAPTAPPATDEGSTLAARRVAKVDVCHRTQGDTSFTLISVAASAVNAHLAHGDGRIGEPVPGQPGMIFDGACGLAPSRRAITVTGRWDGTTYWFAELFTVAAAGPVDATATVTGFTDPMRMALLGFNPQAPSGNSCGTQWLPTELPSGPVMNPPTITAHWDTVPPGTYCLNLVGAAPVPPWPAPYSWTATITSP